MLTERQELILRLVIAEYSATGTPIGSRGISSSGAVDFQPSTIRKEFAVLESHGLLEQPHTSAGRVPTEPGYRYFVDGLLSGGSQPVPKPSFQLSLGKREVDQAMRDTTEALADVTELLALVSAPSISTEKILRVELIALQPRRVMVVVITASGGVTKRIFESSDPIDKGIVTWATGYLNDVLKGIPLGARMVRTHLYSPGLSSTENEFISAISPVFLEPPPGEDILYVGGASHLLSEARHQDLPGLDRLMLALEERVNVLQMLRSVLSERGVFLRIGRENEAPELVGASVVGANYGTPSRNLGSVSVIGPVRMDYPRAIASVRYAAARLSDFVADVYA